MARLEELTPGSMVKGILLNQQVAVVDVKWHGSGVAELFEKNSPNIFPADHPAVRDWDEFIRHGQALAVDVFGTIRQSSCRDAVVDVLARELSVPHHEIYYQTGFGTRPQAYW